jgi:mannose-1-phosphate guanylyltransferase
MKAIIFAGGVGTRLWPLSRKKSPKQFQKIIGEKSTLELAVERLRPEFAAEDIYISTGAEYVERTREMLPYLPEENVIGEPAKKDVGPAVALIVSHLNRRFPDEPIVILWSDHLVKHEQVFKNIVLAAGKVLEKEGDKIVFLGQKPRFASDNLGWIATGEVAHHVDGTLFRRFEEMKYRPNEELARTYFQNPNYCWNLGYFVTTPKFLMSVFERHAPEIFAIAQDITDTPDSASFMKKLSARYAEMPEVNFDKAVLEKLDRDSAYVVIEDIGWSDVGAWEALKEALSLRKTDNIQKGKVILRESSDNLVYNFEDGKLVVGIDMHDFVVINTPDVTLVARKASISKVKELVESLYGSEYESLT